MFATCSWLFNRVCKYFVSSFLNSLARLKSKRFISSFIVLEIFSKSSLPFSHFVSNFKNETKNYLKKVEIYLTQTFCKLFFTSLISAATVGTLSNLFEASSFTLESFFDFKFSSIFCQLEYILTR